MKRILLLIALFLIIGANVSNAQVQRRVLEEEFTNTGCPPCAATDPFVEAFENANFDNICVLKYHTSWPDNTDPFYNAQKVLTWDDARIQTYYGQNGVPFIKMSGLGEPMHRLFNVSGTTYAQMAQDLVDSMNAAKSLMSPFTIDVSQKIIGDSIISIITVKAVATLPSATDLRLACVFAERFNGFHGSNGRPYYTNIVREVMPGIAANGSISTTTQYPVFTINNGETKTIRFADKLNPKWNPVGLYTVAYIQSAGTKEIFQSNWNVPNISIASVSTGVLTVGDGSNYIFSLTNNSAKTQNMLVTLAAQGVPTGWNLKIIDPPNGMMTLNAGETKNFSVAGASGLTASGIVGFGVTASTNDSIGAAGASGTALGKDTKDVLVNAGQISSAKINLINSSLTKIGYSPVIVDGGTFSADFPDWGKFRTILYLSGDLVGQFNVNNFPANFNSLNTYLTNGGHFLICSDGLVGYYYNFSQTYGDSYNQPLRDNFHIEPQPFSQTNLYAQVLGVKGDPIGDGITSTVTGIVLSQPLLSSDEGGISSFYNENGDTIGMRSLVGNGKSVYLSFGLDQVKTTDRDLFVKRIMDWFAGIASVKTSDVASAMKISNYPNPVAKSTKFDYSLTERGLVNLAVYDVMGREVSRIVSNETEGAGTYSADFDASRLSNGSYTYVLTAGSKKVVGTMTVTK